MQKIVNFSEKVSIDSERSVRRVIACQTAKTANLMSFVLICTAAEWGRLGGC